MRLASITVTSSRESIIGDAIRSVEPWVDCVLIVDVGIEDRTLEVVKEIAGDKVRVVQADSSLNMAGMRNAGLAEAERLGMDWAVQLDTDERINLNGCDIRHALCRSSADVLLVLSDNGLFQRERFFRLPAGRYTMGVHESYDPEARCEVLAGARFHELPKTQEQIERRLANDLPGLLRQIEDDPGNARWVYYLGSTYEHLHEYSQAVGAYKRCAGMPGPQEQRAWACFRGAVCLEHLGDCSEALALCAEGLRYCPGVGELPWLAGVLSLRLAGEERDEQAQTELVVNAINWSQMALTLSAGSLAEQRRTGFRSPQGLFEGPFEVLERCWRALGNGQVADKLAAEVVKLRDRREAWAKGGAA